LTMVLLLGYPNSTMLSNVMGIKQFQTQLPMVARNIKAMGGHYLVTNRNEPVMVAISFEDYQSVEDILLEMNSPALQKDVADGRREYLQGKTTKLSDFLAGTV